MLGATRIEELLTWQLTFKMSVEVAKYADRPPACRDFEHRDQIKDASDSVQRNVAEGFARYEPPQFLVFLNVARGSATETRALLRKGLDLGYLPESEFKRLDGLVIRGLQALAKLQRYLRSEIARQNAKRARYSRKRPPRNANDPNDSNDSNDPHDPNASNDSNH